MDDADINIKRDRRVTIRLSEAEYADLSKKSETLEVPLSAYVRKAIAKQKIPERAL